MSVWVVVNRWKNSVFGCFLFITVIACEAEYRERRTIHHSLSVTEEQTIAGSIVDDVDLDSNSDDLIDTQTWHHIQQQFQKLNFKNRDRKGFMLNNKQFMGTVIDKIYNSSTCVFELIGLPKLIFKLDTNRILNFPQAKKIIQDYHLFRLVLPRVEGIAVPYNSSRSEYTFHCLVEQKYPIASNVRSIYDHYYRSFYNRPLLKEQFREAFLHMTRFIVHTNLDDISYANLPLLHNSRGQIKMILVDIAQMGDRYDYKSGILSLLWMAHPDFHDDIIKEAVQSLRDIGRFSGTIDQFVALLDAKREALQEPIKKGYANRPDDWYFWSGTSVANMRKLKKQQLA